HDRAAVAAMVARLVAVAPLSEPHTSYESARAAAAHVNVALLSEPSTPTGAAGGGGGSTRFFALAHSAPDVHAEAGVFTPIVRAQTVRVCSGEAVRSHVELVPDPVSLTVSVEVGVPGAPPVRVTFTS